MPPLAPKVFREKASGSRATARPDRSTDWRRTGHDRQQRSRQGQGCWRDDADLIRWRHPGACARQSRSKSVVAATGRSTRPAATCHNAPAQRVMTVMTLNPKNLHGKPCPGRCSTHTAKRMETVAIDRLLTVRSVLRADITEQQPVRTCSRG
jgi:hypothetical protein